MKALLSASSLAQKEIELIKALSKDIASQVVKDRVGEDAARCIHETSKDSKRSKSNLELLHPLLLLAADPSHGSVLDGIIKHIKLAL